MEISARHWLIALLIAGLFHAALAYALVRTTAPVVEQSGGVTLELGLGGEPALAGAGGGDAVLSATSGSEAAIQAAAPMPAPAVGQAQTDRATTDNSPALQPVATSTSVVVAKALPEPRPTPPSAATAKRAKTTAKPRAREKPPKARRTTEAPQTKPAARTTPEPRSAPKLAAPRSSKHPPRNRTKADHAAGKGRRAGAPGSGDGGRSTAGAGTGGQGGGKGGSGDKAAAQNYYGRLATWLARHKRYPNQARRLRQEGTVKITFTVASNGRVVSKRISKSSGHALLDREVQDMLDRASPLPRIPSSLKRSSITITLPVAFNLR